MTAPRQLLVADDPSPLLLLKADSRVTVEAIWGWRKAALTVRAVRGRNGVVGPARHGTGGSGLRRLLPHGRRTTQPGLSFVSDSDRSGCSPTCTFLDTVVTYESFTSLGPIFPPQFVRSSLRPLNCRPAPCAFGSNA
jgi:hypothetical protein